MSVAMIAACGQNRELGKDNKMLWHIPEEFKYFKATTMGGVLIMGRKTYESIGRPLPGRENYVVSRQANLDFGPKVKVFPSLEAALQAAQALRKDVFICGGAQIYSQGLELSDQIYLTQVEYQGDADVYFPELGEEWQLESSEQAPIVSGQLNWKKQVYQRRDNTK